MVGIQRQRLGYQSGSKLDLVHHKGEHAAASGERNGVVLSELCSATRKASCLGPLCSSVTHETTPQPLRVTQCSHRVGGRETCIALDCLREQTHGCVIRVAPLFVKPGKPLEIVVV